MAKDKVTDIKFTDLAKFQDKQKEAWYTLMLPETKYMLYGGAASGGKSYFLRWAAIGLGMYYFSKYGLRNVPIGLFSADYPTLKDRQVIKIKNEIPDFLGHITESRDEGYAFIGAPAYGSFLVLLRNLDDPSKYKSAEFASILVEELTENPESTFDDLRFRLRYGQLTDTKFVGASNPGGVGHGFVKRKWVKPDLSSPDHEQDRFKFVQAKYSDNNFTTEEYVKQLESLPDDKRRAYKEGDWDIFAGQYFSEWRDFLHVTKPTIPSKYVTKIGGLDWGRSAPFAFLGAAVKNETFEGINFRRIVVYQEVYGTEKTPRQWGELIQKAVNLQEYSSIQADNQIYTKGNDNSISIYDQFVQTNPLFRKLKPASKDRVGGWENVHNWLTLAPDGLPYLMVTSNCINLIRTLPELIHDKTRVEDVDTQGEDHAPDALSYMLKSVKWIDAKLGAIGGTDNRLKARINRPLDLDLSKFETNPKTKRDWRAI